MAGLPLDATFVAIALGVLVLAGLVKGVIGIGLPLITIPALSFFVGVPQAIAIMSLPILVTNGYQAFASRELPRVARRFWPLLIPLLAGVVLGASLLDCNCEQPKCSTWLTSTLCKTNLWHGQPQF